MRRSLFAILLASSSLFFAGCAVQPDGVSTDEEGAVADGADALTLTNARLSGAWASTGGTIYKIDFTSEYAQTIDGRLKGKKFTATIDNGIRCITTPCPSTTEVVGIYKLSGSGKTLTLAAPDKPSREFSVILGDYRSAISADATTLTLNKLDGTINQTFNRPCGDVICGAGTTCCNPLMNICAKIGMMCIQ
jgi:hypothetical protein